MKGKNLREIQEQYKETVVGLCLVCQKQVKGGWYGRHQEVGTCSKKCEQVQSQKPKYLGYEEEDFFNRINAQGEQP